MNVAVGKIVYLAGPSSSGKSTYAKEQVKEGWVHLEVDEIMISAEITEMEEWFPNQMEKLKSSMNNPTVMKIHAIMMDRMKVAPELEEAQRQLSEIWDSRMKEKEVRWKRAFIHTLIKAKDTAQKGSNVIIDFVPLFNEHPITTTYELMCDKGDIDFWEFRGVKIEQKLKYVTIERLMLNVISRNQDPLNYRSPIKVLLQYAEQFRAVINKEEKPIGVLNINSLLEFIQIAVPYDDYFEKKQEIFKCMLIQEGEISEVPITYRSKLKTNLSVVT